MFSSWRLRVPQGVTYEKVTTFQGTRQARTYVLWSIQDHEEREEEFKVEFSNFFSDPSESRG
jgi:hypothetical protein